MVQAWILLLKNWGRSLSTLPSEALFCCCGCNPDGGRSHGVVLLYFLQKYLLHGHSRDIWPMKNSWAAGLTRMRGGATGKHEAVSPITPTDGAVTGPNCRMHISSNPIPASFRSFHLQKRTGRARKVASSCGNNDITGGCALHGHGTEPAALADAIARSLAQLPP